MPQRKKCFKCGEVKGLDRFHKDRSRKDGLQSCCKDCARQYRKRNQEAERERERRYYAESKEALCERQRLDYRKYREISREVATRNGMPWTKTEDNFLLSTGMTDLEAAVELGRTKGSVSIRKHHLRKNLQTI